jgi:hypothetical protein
VPAERDLARRLAFFGVLSILVGVGALAMAALNLALPWLVRLAPGVQAAGWRVAAAGALTWGLIAALLVWAGIGSLRCRRWTRSVMLVLAWSWLLCGSLMLAVAWWLLDDLLLAASGGDPRALSDDVATVAKAVMLAALGGGGVALPALFVWAYQDPAILDTCARRHPAADWTADCPVPVLGLSLGLAACGLFALPLALHAVVPFFGIVRGAPAVLLVLGGAAACLWLGRATYRREPAGLWGTAALLLALGAALVATFARGGTGELLVAYGFAAEQAAGLTDAGPLFAWGSAVLTVASLGYLVAVRRHFRWR